MQKHSTKRKFPRLGKVEQVIEGKTHRYHRRKNGKVFVYTACCDCGLVHLEIFEPNKNYISVKAWRAEKLTKMFRGSRRIVTQRGKRGD